MLPIICKGRGLIPRVGIIAPMLTPFKVDELTLTIIMKTPGSVLDPYFVHPETLEQVELTNTNFQRIYDNYQKELLMPAINQIPDEEPGREHDDEGSNKELDDEGLDDEKSDDLILHSIPGMGEESDTDEDPGKIINTVVKPIENDAPVKSDDASTVVPVITKPAESDNNKFKQNYNNFNNRNNNRH